MDIIRARDLTFSYPKAKAPAVDNINIEVEESDFVVICGHSGCGKTTLVRNLKREIAPVGKRTGEIYYKGQKMEDIDTRQSAKEIGFVMQNPESQIVTDTVWHELAFGLENIEVPSNEIRRRVAETANFFGINGWFEKNVNELSGGQKQILNLASIMAMQPKLIILDEPTAQLDPIAAKDFLTALNRINMELGMTVIITEHRLEEVFPIANKVIYMEDAKVNFFGSTQEFIADVAQNKQHAFINALPSASRISIHLGDSETCPVTVREGRLWLESRIEKLSEGAPETEAKTTSTQPEKPVLQGKDIWWRYSAKDKFVLTGLSCDIFSGKITSIVGGNGSGKSTALCLLAGLYEPIRGSVKLDGKRLGRAARVGDHRVAMLTQNPKSMFVCDTVYDDLKECAKLAGTKDDEEQRINEISKTFGIDHLLNSHPYDLSGGELQKAAIAKLLLLNTDILLLDEPTKGIDVNGKEELARILRERCKAGNAIVVVTHDIEFVAKYSDKCAMIFNGEVICYDDAKDFFVGNTFYTTSAYRMSRNIAHGAVTCEDVIKACKAI